MKLKALSILYFAEYMNLVNDSEIHEFTQPGENFKEFTESEIRTWLQEISLKEDRFDFAILSESNEFVGEVVLNQIKGNECNFRIAILPKFFNQSYGSFACREICKFAFEKTNIEKIHLDVFEINPRAQRLYEKTGFQETSRIKNENSFIEIHMELAKEDFQKKFK
ncbi:MAG: GNAT family N-acetyltransferase [Bdellovibrionota bacterium]|nr:GNAT family N-acetyltransferase [Bdellovibrionota bacterium]